MSDYLDRVNKTKITGDLLREVVRMHADMEPEDRPVFEARAGRMFELLSAKGFGNRKVADFAIAIDFRLRALAHLQKDRALRGWSRPGDLPGMDYMQADLFDAAAEEPLIDGDEGQAVFDTESFRRRVLANATVEGNA